MPTSSKSEKQHRLPHPPSRTSYGSLLHQELKPLKDSIAVTNDGPTTVAFDFGFGAGAEPPFPYSANNPISILFFSWFEPLLRLGNAKPQLDFDDVSTLPLRPDDETGYVSGQFDGYWENEKRRVRIINEEREREDEESRSTGGRMKWRGREITPSLARCLFQAFGWDFARAGFLKLVHDVLQFVGPQVLNGFIYYLRDPNAPLSHGLLLTAAVVASQIVMSLCLRHYFFRCYRTGMNIRTAIVAAVYRKALVLSSTERQRRTVGEITNLMSIDSQRLQDITTFLHAIWYSCVQIGLAIYFLWGQLGPSILAGVAVIVCMIPVTGYVAKWMGRLQKKLMKAKDKRVEVNNEVMGSMKIVKVQAWEGSFQDRIEDLRNKELKQLFYYLLGRCCSFILWSTVPLLIALTTFAAYTLAGNKLEVASALTALALFDILRFPLFMLPNVINSMVEAKIALDRVTSFLLCEEHLPVGPGSMRDVGVSMENATFVYDGKRPKPSPVGGGRKRTTPEQRKAAQELDDARWEMQLLKSQLADAEGEIRRIEAAKRRKEEEGGESAPLLSKTQSSHAGDLDAVGGGDLLSLRRVNFDCNAGELVAVVGAVGAGKSTFLNAILGEVRLVSGSVSVNGRLAFFGQSPFIMNDTVRGNIVFGSGAPNVPMYEAAIEACSLRHDIGLLPNGDLCEIGEKGITLSGGQKARVAMARALYHNADVYLLDDPLAAVDAHVGRHLFEKCIIEELLLGKGNIWSSGRQGEKKSKTVILVTNALQYLSHPLVDRIVVLKDGRVAESGSYKELVKDEHSLFKTFLDSFFDSMAENEVEEEEEDTPIIIEDQSDQIDPPPMFQLPKRRTSVTRSQSVTAYSGALTIDPLPKAKRAQSVKMASVRFSPKKEEAPAKSLMTDELQERASGHVDKKVYVAWARAAGGVWVGVLIIFAYLAVEGVNVLSQWWLTYWSHQGAEGGEEVSQLEFLAIYAVINLTAVVATFFRMSLVMFSGLRAASKLFSRLLDATLRAPMSFFDTTPLGRIINRFSKDIYTLDEQLPSTLMTYLTTMASVCSTIIVISTVTPVFAWCLIPILFLYERQQAFFTSTYRELKRLDSVSRSPIYALFGESLDGVATIRAFSAQFPLLERMVSMLDRQQNAYFLTYTAQCWLGVRLEMIGTLIILSACLAVVWEHGAKGGDEVFAGLAGLSISYALSVTQALNWSVRMSSDLEANMVAVERVEQYCQLENEAARDTSADKQIDPKWPAQGVIEFKGVKLRYRQGLPLVLKGLDITIPGHSKVGVVGRTGAGKSTLMVALLRIVELDSGMIRIDGIDISSLGLTKLRSKIAVIPQDPVLFSGSVRFNLDPFEEHSDDHLCNVLSRVGLMSRTGQSSGMSKDEGQGDNAHPIKSLSDDVLEGGTNFSVGQRQLLVIARALLGGASVVICDEATAAVDAETDAKIQAVMRTDFKDATCITVAHRLNTIMDSDTILVMDDGQAAEFGPPSKLLSKGGLFKDLVDTWEEEHEQGQGS